VRLIDEKAISTNLTTVVPAAAHTGVVHPVKRRVDPVFDQRSDGIEMKIVSERFSIVSTVRGQRPAGQSSRHVFRARAVNVVDMQRFHIHEGGGFERADAVVFSRSTERLIAVETSRVDRGMASAFLG
jgi:hypothetical protein